MSVGLKANVDGTSGAVQVNGNDVVTVNSSGQVGVGTSSPTTALNIARSGASDAYVRTNNDSISAIYGIGGAFGAILGTVSSHPVAFYAGNNERARIDTAGDFRVGTTTGNVGYAGGSGLAIEQSGKMHSGVTGATDCFYIQKDNTGGSYLKFFYGALNAIPATVGAITTNGTITNYNTLSDYRLKDIDGPVTNSGAYIDALNPVQGRWKADGSRFIGLIAHEVQEVSETQIATGTKDGEETQAMDYSAPEIIANLIAELKSLRARVAALEDK